MEFLKSDKIEYRLRRAIAQVCIILTLAGLLGVASMFILGHYYNKAINKYALPQGDIGMAMVVLTDTYDNLSNVIGLTEDKYKQQEYKSYLANKAQYEKYLNQIEPTMVTPEGVASFKKISESSEKYWEEADQLLEVGMTSDNKFIVERRLMDEINPLYNEVRTNIYELMSVNIEKTEGVQGDMLILRAIMMLVIILIIAISAVVSMIIGRRIASGITISLSSLSERLFTFAQGDLHTPFPTLDKKDEVADMLEAGSSMASELYEIVTDVSTILSNIANGDFRVKSTCEDKYRGDFKDIFASIGDLKTSLSYTLSQIDEAATQVSDGSEQLSTSAQDLAEGATEQAGAVEELTATIQDVTSIAEKSADSASIAVDSSIAAAQIATKSRNEMEDLVAAMERITETSKEIEGIIGDIEDIASQTNLLSLNASIEAARAGEAGRGFAVVADQIGKLANDSAQSAVRTRDLIAKSLEEIGKGNIIASEAMSSISTVLATMEEFQQISDNSANAFKTQANMLEQIQSGIEQIAEVTQNNSAASEETSAVSQELSAQSIQLKEMLGKFKLEK